MSKRVNGNVTVENPLHTYISHHLIRLLGNQYPFAVHYCILLELEPPGEANVISELKLAICRKSECEFRAPWGSREQVDKQSRTHDTSGLSGVIPEQQTKFENIKTYGDNNVVGSKNPITLSYVFHTES